MFELLKCFQKISWNTVKSKTFLSKCHRKPLEKIKLLYMAGTWLVWCMIVHFWWMLYCLVYDWYIINAWLVNLCILVGCLAGYCSLGWWVTTHGMTGNCLLNEECLLGAVMVFALCTMGILLLHNWYLLFECWVIFIAWQVIA